MRVEVQPGQATLHPDMSIRRGQFGLVEGGDGDIQAVRAEAGEQRQLRAAGWAEAACARGWPAYSRGMPASQRKLVSGTLIQVVTMPPLLRRQVEQWQWAMSCNGAVNS